MKIFKKSKAKKDAKIAEGIKSLTDKFKLREKIDKANQWADKHKKRVSVITISMLMLSLIIGSWLTLTSTFNETDMLSDFTEVKPAFDGIRRAQARPRLPRPSARKEPPGLCGHRGEVPPVRACGQVPRQQTIN